MDKIALIDHPISDDDLTLYILNGPGVEYREIAAPIRARENSMAFEGIMTSWLATKATYINLTLPPSNW